MGQIIANYKLIIFALEKQLPKKVIKINYKVKGNIDKGVGGICPICKSFVGGYSGSGTLTYKAKYCLECGQKLDWEKDK